MKATYLWTTLVLSPVLFLASCIRDDIYTPPKSQEPQITFSLQLPRALAAAPATGLTEEEERMISDLTILLFKDTSSGDLKCEKMVENLTPTAVPGTNNIRYTVTTPLPMGRYHIMLLANLPAGSLPAATTPGTLLSDIESTLLYQMPAKWDISTHIGFPMWGMTEGHVIITGSYTHPDPILMLRMLSRINLSVDDTVKDDIKISTIRLHNPSSRGVVIPDEATLDRTTTPGYIRVTAPTLPLNSGGNPDPVLLSTPWEYTSTEIDEGNYCLNTIYALEGFDPQGRNEDEYAWLEVVCSYKGGPEEAHRIDFVRTLADGTRTPIGLLRNHSYEIRILSMSGSANLEFEVMDWNDSDLSDIIFEGKYYLKVNQSKFELDRESHDKNSFTNKLTLQTNYEEGWVIDRITEPGNGATIDIDNGWVQIAPEDRTGPQHQETTISILLEENNTGAPRSAEIHLHVGRLIDFIVSVTQHVERKLELHIEDPEGNPLEELVFYDFYGNDKPYEQKAFRVRWSPYGANSATPGRNFECQIRTTVVGDEHFDYKPGTEPITTGVLTDTTGIKEYIIEPTPFTNDQVSERLGNPFLQHASWVTFTVTDPDDPTQTISKTIYLNHQHIAITSRNFRRLSYLGRAYTFNVQANTPWVIEKIEPQEEEFQISNYTPVGTTGGNNILEGHKLIYTTPTENPGSGLKGIRQAGRKATFYLRDQRGIIPDLVPFTITAVCEDPNSFIVHPSPSGSTLRIPIRKLFWIREREAGDASIVDLLHNSNAYEPHIVWQEYYDQTGVERQDYQVSLTSIPDGSNALEDFLEVTFPPTPSNGVMGNALVGIKRKGTNNLLWSWHIWLTDYNPEPTAGGSLEVEDAWFMYRNLGALSDEHQLNAHTIGFYYQWGRKDPLRPKDIPTHRQAPALENLIHAINAPDVFFTGGGKEDWFTSSGLRPYQNDFLWTEYDDYKSQYDPCPEGWRVPNFIHEKGMAMSLWYQLFRYNHLMENTDFLGAFLRRKSNGQGTLFMPGGGYYDLNGTLQDYKKEAMNFNANASQYDDTPHYGLYAGQGIYGGGDEIDMPRASAMPVRCVKRK